jgi:hypothetical protein
MTPEELLPIARSLVRLLEDPQPGLFTWQKMVRETIEEIHKAVE